MKAKPSNWSVSQTSEPKLSASVCATAVVSLYLYLLGSTIRGSSGATSNTKKKNYAMCECENAREVTTYIGHTCRYHIQYIYIYI